MAILRLRYEKGHFTPLDPLPNTIQEGAEIAVQWNPPISPEYREMLDQTRGLWADWEEDVEGLLEDAKAKQDQAWLDNNLPSL